MMNNYSAHLMGDLRSVLLCTDGSDFCAGAIRAAINLARECMGAKLWVLRVIEHNPEFETEGGKFADDVEHAAREHLDLIREVAADENVECHGIVERTERADEGILREAVRRKADIIVTGRRDLTGLRKTLSGSVSGGVISSAPCKVLVVPRDAVMKGEHILLATDGTAFSTAAEKETLSMGARCRQIGTVTILSVALSDDEKAAAQRIVDRIARDARLQSIETQGIVRVGKPHDVILKYLQDHKVDMIILGTQGRTGIRKLLSGSVAEKVITRSPSAVLVVRS